MFTVLFVTFLKVVSNKCHRGVCAKLILNVCQICEGDNVLVTIENKMTDETTSIHWHGILMEGTPYMDGVPFLTQCPVNPGETFLVNFTAVDWGTHYWHGHTGNV